MYLISDYALSSMRLRMGVSNNAITATDNASKPKCRKLYPYIGLVICGSTICFGLVVVAAR